MKRLLYILLGSCLVLFVIGCNQGPATGPEKTVTLNPEAGRFGLSHLNGLNKVKNNSAVKEGENVRFQLGKIKGSTGFFFLLYNTGATPITDVTLNIANTAFSVNPASMDTLIPGSDLGMLPIVKVSVFHSTPLDGIGNRPLLPMGKNECTLTITGHTKTASGDDTTVQLQAALELDALVMDFEIVLPNGKLDITGLSSGADGYLGDLTEFSKAAVSSHLAFCKTDTTVTIRNTGNIALPLRAFSCSSQDNTAALKSQQLADTVLPVAASMTFPLDNLSRDASVLFAVLGDNTVGDPSRIPQDDKGNCYVQVVALPFDCAIRTAATKFNEFIESKKEIDCAKIFALIDNAILFYGQGCKEGEDTAYVFNLSELSSGTLLCSQSGTEGNLTAQCNNQAYSGLMDTLVTSLFDPNTNISKLGLVGRVNQCTAMYWPQGRYIGGK